MRENYDRKFSPLAFNALMNDAKKIILKTDRSWLIWYKTFENTPQQWWRKWEQLKLIATNSKTRQLQDQVKWASIYNSLRIYEKLQSMLLRLVYAKHPFIWMSFMATTTIWEWRGFQSHGRCFKVSIYGSVLRLKAEQINYT